MMPLVRLTALVLAVLVLSSCAGSPRVQTTLPLASDRPTFLYFNTDD